MFDRKMNLRQCLIGMVLASAPLFSLAAGPSASTAAPASTSAQAIEVMATPMAGMPSAAASVPLTIDTIAERQAKKMAEEEVKKINEKGNGSASAVGSAPMASAVNVAPVLVLPKIKAVKAAPPRFILNSVIGMTGHELADIRSSNGVDSVQLRAGDAFYKWNIAGIENGHIVIYERADQTGEKKQKGAASKVKIVRVGEFLE